MTLRSERAQRVRLRVPRVIQTLTKSGGEATVETGQGKDSRILSLPAKQDVTLAITLS